MNLAISARLAPPLLVGLALVLPSPALATDWTVSEGGSIQAAIDQATSGDRILVEPGTYTTSIDLRGKDVEIIATGGAAVTTIDGRGLPLPTVVVESGESQSAALVGITVFGGMLAALLVGTFFIPGFYAIVQSLREKIKGTPAGSDARSQPGESS